jgi:hypothetical protein
MMAQAEAARLVSQLLPPVAGAELHPHERRSLVVLLAFPRDCVRTRSRPRFLKDDFRFQGTSGRRTGGRDGDDRAVRPNLGEVFGTLLPEAQLILVPNAGALWLDPPPESPTGVALPPAPDRGQSLVLTLRDGRLMEAAR